MLPVSVGATTLRFAPFVPVPEGTQETFIHLPTALLVLPFGAFILRTTATGRLRRAFGLRHAMGLFCVFTLAVLWGLARGGENTITLYYLQTLLPLAAFVLGTQSTASPYAVARSMLLGSVLSGLLALYLVGGRAIGRGAVSQATTRIPQFRNLFPLVLMVGLLVALSFFGRARLLAALMVVVTLLLLPSLWSRAGLIFAAVGVVTLAVLSIRNYPSKHRRVLPSRALRTLTICALLATAGLAGFELASGGIIGERNEAVPLGSARVQRQHLATEGLRRIASRPLLGDAFRTVGVVRAGGNRADVPILFPAHNQFIDYGIRAGAAAALLLAALLLGIGRRALAISALGDEEEAQFGKTAFAIIIGASVGCLFHLYLIQGITASIIWFVAGYISRLHSSVAARQTRGSPSTTTITQRLFSRTTAATVRTTSDTSSDVS